MRPSPAGGNRSRSAILLVQGVRITSGISIQGFLQGLEVALGARVSYFLLRSIRSPSGLTLRVTGSCSLDLARAEDTIGSRTGVVVRCSLPVPWDEPFATHGGGFALFVGEVLLGTVADYGDR